MFQPQVNTNVNNSLRQRLAAIERLIDSEAPDNILMRTSHQLNQITEQIRRLGTGLNEDSRRTLNQYCSRLRRTLDAVLSHRANPINVEVDDDTDVNNTGRGDASRDVGRPKKSIDKNNLQSWLDLGFSVTDIAKKNLLGTNIHRNTISSFRKWSRLYGREKDTVA